MRKQIYEYIKAHNWVTVVDVVEALNINGNEVLATIMALQKEGFLQQSLLHQHDHILQRKEYQL